MSLLGEETFLLAALGVNKISRAVISGQGDRAIIVTGSIELSDYQQEALEKCWAHSLLRAAARPNFTLLLNGQRQYHVLSNGLAWDRLGA